MLRYKKSCLKIHFNHHNKDAKNNFSTQEAKEAAFPMLDFREDQYMEVEMVSLSHP